MPGPHGLEPFPTFAPGTVAFKGNEGVREVGMPTPLDDLKSRVSGLKAEALRLQQGLAASPPRGAPVWDGRRASEDPRQATTKDGHLRFPVPASRDRRCHASLHRNVPAAHVRIRGESRNTVPSPMDLGDLEARVQGDRASRGHHSPDVPTHPRDQLEGRHQGPDGPRRLEGLEDDLQALPLSRRGPPSPRLREDLRTIRAKPSATR